MTIIHFAPGRSGANVVYNRLPVLPNRRSKIMAILQNSKSSLLSSSRLTVLVIGLCVLTANAMADVSFNGTTFTGEGTYDQAAGTADVPLSTNLVVTGSTDTSTITLSGGFYTTGNFSHNKGVLKIAKGTVNSCNSFGIQKGGANGTTAYIYGTVNANSFTLNKTGGCTAYLNISGNLTVSGYVEFSCAKSGQGILNQTDGVVSFTTSADQDIRIAHWYTDNKYPCRYNLSGGTFNVLNATAYVGWDGPGELNISGGTANIKGIQLVGGWNNSTASGTINLTGGRLNIGSGGITLKKKNHAINLGDGTIGALASHTWASGLTVTLTSGKTPTFDIDANKTITIASTVTGSGNLKKIGAGALTLSGSNNYTGTTTITSGTLTASKIGSIGTGALTLSNATLSAPQGTIPASSVTITGDSTFISSSGWNLFKSFSGSGTLTLTGSGYLAIKDGYTATNYTGSFIVGATDAAGSFALESQNVLNGTSNIRSVNGWIDWNELNQSFNSFEYLDGEMRSMTGTLTLSNEFKYNSSADLNVPGAVAGTADLVKEGSGTLTLSGSNTYTGTTTISDGALKLAGDGTLGTGAVSVGKNAALEIAYASSETTVNIPSITMAENSSIKVTSGTVTFGTEDAALNNLSGEAGNINVNGALTLNNDRQTKYIGAISADTIQKTGDGTLQIYAAAENMIDAQSFVVSSGRLDMKTYYKGALEIGEELDVENYSTATFSPGNSVGTLNIDGDFTLNPGATLLLEFDETGADSLIVSGTTTFAEGSFITLALDDGASVSPNQQISFQLSPNIVTFDNAALSYPSYLTGVSYNSTTGVLSATVDANAVPEPSTWALLVLGFAALFLRKRVRG